MGKYFLSILLALFGTLIAMFIADSFLVMVSYKSTVAVIIGVLGAVATPIGLYYWCVGIKKLLFRKKGN